MGLAQRKIESEPIHTEAEYLAFERAADERSEYLDGVIHAMPGESPEHGDISVNLVRLVSTALLDKPCSTYTKDTKVRSGPLPKSRLHPTGLFSYPDLVVVCGARKYLDEYKDVLVNPTVIIEVVSDSTEEFDRRRKFMRYQQYLPSLVDYILVAQREPAIELFHRPSPKSPRWEYTAAAGLNGRIVIPALKCSLRLSDVYFRVSFTATAPDKGGALKVKGYSTPRRKPSPPVKKKTK